MYNRTTPEIINIGKIEDAHFVPTKTEGALYDMVFDYDKQKKYVSFLI